MSGVVGDKTLAVGQVKHFIAEAAVRGWKRDDAYAQLNIYATDKRWHMQVPEMDKTPQQRCGNCNLVNTLPRLTCFGCNHPLNIKCAGLWARCFSDQAGCSRCGFPVGNAFWMMMSYMSLKSVAAW